MNKKKISILIPVLNSGSVLEKCLESISNQDYPKEDIEIIIADGGSSDDSLDIAGRYGAFIVSNVLKTGEAGKMTALKAASGEYIALIDSDNILPDKNWLKSMILPLEENINVLGSEPISYTWRKEDGYITRYCSLMGMNDPLVYFLGNYDRHNILSGKWTEVEREEKDCGEYIKIIFTKFPLPTIGANGTIFRSEYIKKYTDRDYLFDIDILSEELKKTGKVEFIKVKTGIIHTFCESDVSKFIRKQIRRVRDYNYYSLKKNIREYNWNSMDISGKKPWGIIKFSIYCVLIFPLVAQSITGFLKKRDYAWFFHIPACILTFLIYSWYRLFGYIYTKEMDRIKWKQ